MPIPQDLLDKIMGTTGNSTIAPKRGAEILANTTYPRSWDDFIGQDQAVEQLRVAAVSAKSRGVRLDHIMLASGLHGIGKTTLATLVAVEAEVGFLQTSGPLNIDQARDLFMACEDHDIVFIDEAHSLVTGGKRQADWLLPFMLEGKLYGPRGAEDMPDVTIICATTDAGVLPATILSRFPITPELVPYTDAEAGTIAVMMANDMHIEDQLTTDQCQEVARAADNNPRAIRKVLSQVRDLQFSYPETSPNLAKAFRFAGVSADGLTLVAREILVLLVLSADNTLSSESIRAQLGEPGPLHQHEQQLMQRGLMHVTGRGRRLTDTGIIRASEAIAEIQGAA